MDREQEAAKRRELRRRTLERLNAGEVICFDVERHLTLAWLCISLREEGIAETEQVGSYLRAWAKAAAPCTGE
jgi:hypothetical protein